MMESIIDGNKLYILLFFTQLFNRFILKNQKNRNRLSLGFIETIILLIKLSKLLQIFYCKYFEPFKGEKKLLLIIEIGVV